MHKMYYTNNAINFFLYVISGQKFRNDLINLFKCNYGKHSKPKETSLSIFSGNKTNVSIVEMASIEHMLIPEFA